MAVCTPSFSMFLTNYLKSNPTTMSQNKISTWKQAKANGYRIKAARGKQRGWLVATYKNKSIAPFSTDRQSLIQACFNHQATTL